MGDGMTSHTCNTLMTFRVISFVNESFPGIWPTRSPDLTSSDDLLRRAATQISRTNNRDMPYVRDITVDQLDKVFKNKLKHVPFCIDERGSHLQHVLSNLCK